MRARSASITDLPISPDEARQRRFRLYMILMLVRVASLGVFFVVPGWWKLIPAFLAVFLPYFAVVIANASTPQVVMDSGRIAPNALPASATPFVEPSGATGAEPAGPTQRTGQSGPPPTGPATPADPADPVG